MFKNIQEKKKLNKIFNYRNDCFERFVIFLGSRLAHHVNRDAVILCNIVHTCLVLTLED